MKKKSKAAIAVITIASSFFFTQEAGAAGALGTDVMLFVRYQDQLLFSQAVPFPASGQVTLIDADGVLRSVNSRSVLALLSSADALSPAFGISQLQYFSSFSSLYLKCMNTGVQACDNWQYVVNDTTPFVGMDGYVLSGGEEVYVYFGNSHQVALSMNAVGFGQSFTATSQKYRYQDNVWEALAGVTIGVKSGNSEIAIQSVDAVGNAVFTLNTSPGLYNVGIVEDFYFPSTSLQVYASGGNSALDTSFNQPTISVAFPVFDTMRALNFLESMQKDDGSFGNPMLSDWAAIAIGSSNGKTEMKEKLKTYLQSHQDAGIHLTDYERRAMALMALGVDPYIGTPVNYIEKIRQSFDGSQFGDPGLLNDDVFALVVLLKAGFSSEDEMVEKTLVYLLSHQQEDGSWVEGVDMTAAAIQALALLPQEEVVSKALQDATSFLHDSQKRDGGFGNAFSTSWAIQAIETTGNRKFSWQKKEHTPMSALALFQGEDGGVNDELQENRLWATSYAIPAAQKKPWGEILSNFTNPVFPSRSSGSLEEIEKEVVRIAKEVEALQVEILAMQEAPVSSGQLAVRTQVFSEQIVIDSKSSDMKGIDFASLQIASPETQNDESVLQKMGAGLALVKDGLDVQAFFFAVMGMGLVLAIAVGIPNILNGVQTFRRKFPL